MDTSHYTEYRPLMFSIAYRMTGSVSDAEDLVQEAFLRAGQDVEVASPKAYLATITTRLAIDHLRSARVRRESYVGTWLPEPLIGNREPDPAELAEISDSLSMAFLVLLESLAPAERAVFLLREVFGYEYKVIADITGKTEPGLPDTSPGPAAASRGPAAVRDSRRRGRHIGPISRTWHLRWRDADAEGLDRKGVTPGQAVARGAVGGPVHAGAGDERHEFILLSDVLGISRGLPRWPGSRCTSTSAARSFIVCLLSNHSASVLNFQVPSKYVIGQMYSRDPKVQTG